MKDSGRRTTFRALEPYISAMEMSIKEVFQKINQMEKVSCAILMG